MIVVGISETHCATAAVLRDGEVIGCASEERFSRIKNDAGYPRLALDALLRDLRVDPRTVDLVALGGARAMSREWMNRVLQDDAYMREYYGMQPRDSRSTLERRARKLGSRVGRAKTARRQVETPTRSRRPASASTRIVSPSANSPLRIRLASGFSIRCWITRFSGRAP